MIARLEKSFYGAEELAQLVSDPLDNRLVHLRRRSYSWPHFPRPCSSSSASLDLAVLLALCPVALRPVALPPVVLPPVAMLPMVLSPVTLPPVTLPPLVLLVGLLNLSLHARPPLLIGTIPTRNRYGGGYTRKKGEGTRSIPTVPRTRNR